MLGLTLAGSIGLAAVAFWAGTAVHGGAGSLPAHVSEPPSTVPVRRERLVEAVQGSGTIALPAGTPVTPLPPQLSAPGAQPVITGFPWRVGSRVQDGDVLAEVAGQPIFMLSGETPAYRDLHEGDTGKDVAELQAALDAAGFPVSDPEGTYGSSTAAAVAALYRAHGYTAPLSSKPATSGRSSSGSKAKQSKQTKVVSERTAMVPVWSVVYVKSLPASVSAVHGALGDRLGSGNALLDLTTGGPVADVTVEPALASMLRKGMTAWLTGSEGEGGPRVRGHIERVVVPSSNGSSSSGGEESASSGSTEGSGSQAASKVIVAFPANAAGLRVGVHVNASIIRASSHDPVLVVPASAVQVAADAAEYVDVRRDGTRRRVAVRQGVTAAGNVAVSPRAGEVLRSGEEVVIPN
ncbi:MAG: peptidoglycan-binding protein [Solirubrobacteraceae bacterium]